MSSVGAWIAVAMTVSFTVYGQLIIKMRVLQAGPMGADLQGKLFFLARLLLDPWVLSGFFCAFLASLCWMAAMTRLPVSLAYPFTSLGFVLVTLLGATVFHEQIKLMQMAGIMFVILGLVIIARA